MVRAFALLFLALPRQAAAAAPPPLSAVVETEAYASADQAAVAALRLAMPLSDRHEHGGAIVQKDGAFYYSEPASNGDPGHIRFTAAIPPGARLVAIYHTHPAGGQDSRLFSWDDVAEARKLGTTSYIGVLDDRTVRRFTPGRTATRPYETSGSPFSRGRVSDGEIVVVLING